MVAGGSLIHTLAGRSLGCGQRPRNRSGCAWQAAWRVAARRAWTWTQAPSWTDAGVVHRDAGVAVLSEPFQPGCIRMASRSGDNAVRNGRLLCDHIPL
jgi:hypothetical protein